MPLPVLLTSVFTERLGVIRFVLNYLYLLKHPSIYFVFATVTYHLYHVSVSLSPQISSHPYNYLFIRLSIDVTQFYTIWGQEGEEQKMGREDRRKEGRKEGDDRGLTTATSTHTLPLHPPTHTPQTKTTQIKT